MLINKSVTPLFTLLFSVCFSSILFADTITIGKGAGIVWTGNPFSIQFNEIYLSDNSTSYSYATVINPLNALFSISHVQTTRGCIAASSLRNVGGYYGWPISAGAILVPRFTISSDYVTQNKQAHQLVGTIGIPSTNITTTEGVTVPLINANNNIWCFNPRNIPVTESYYSNSAWEKKVRVSGDWAIVTDGQQKIGSFNLPQLFGITQQPISTASTPSHTLTNIQTAPIFPASTIRVSNISCTVATPMNIDFGRLFKTSIAGSELGIISNPLTVSCSQSPQYFSANIKVQFNALSGIYNADPTRLAIAQGGGYITGEINNGITGSGKCDTSSGIPFDNTHLQIGAIQSSDISKTFNNIVTWRLCEGANIASGPVSATAEMTVTVN